MKNVLFIYHTSSIGGGSYCLLNILKTLDRNNIKPVVLLRDKGPLVDEIQKYGIEVILFPLLRTVPYNTSTLTPAKIKNAFTLIKGLKRYRQILKSINPDTVYVNTMMLYPYLRDAKRMGINTIIHIREHWPSKEHKYQRKIALKSIVKYADHIVAINKFSASMFCRFDKPLTIVYDWIDLRDRYEDFHLSSVFGEDMNDKKVYLFLGGMQPIKGTLEVIQTFSKVVKDQSARLLIMGIDNLSAQTKGLRGMIKNCLSLLGYKTYSKSVIQAIGKDNRIRCISGRYKLNNIIQQSYCILSYFTIPHANLALAESIILGTPSIAAKTPESMEYSLDGKLAELYPINDKTEFERRLIGFNDVRQNLIAKINRYSKIVSGIFDPKVNSSKINEIILSIK